MSAALAEFHYRLAWEARGHRPGFHRSRQNGGGQDFRGHAPLLAAPDPRRLDLRASLRDPHENFLVRVYQQRASVPVFLVADLSASMGYTGRLAKLGVLADFAASLGYSAHRTGDRFGFLGCDETVRREFTLPPTHSRGAGPLAARRLREFTPAGRSAAGLLLAHRHLPRQRSLVFLASDFHFPMNFTRRLADSFAHHDLVPLVLWDEAEFDALPRRGFAMLADPEGGRPRFAWMRPRLAEAVREAFAERRAALRRLFLPRGRAPFFLSSRFDPDAMSEYFLTGGAA